MNKIKYTRNKRSHTETYFFLEDGKEIDKLVFSTWNEGNLGGNIVSDLLNKKITKMIDRGWTYESLDVETKEEYGEFFGDGNTNKIRRES